MKTALDKNLPSDRTSVWHPSEPADIDRKSAPNRIASDGVLWTIDDVATYCRVEVSVIKYWLRSSDIPYVKLGRQRRFDPKDVKLWIEERKKGFNARGTGDFRRVT